MPAPFDVTAESVGEDGARAMMAWTERAIDTIEALAGDSFRRVGSLRLAVDEEERDELRTEYEALVAAGFAAEWIESFEPPLAGRFTAALRHVPDGVLQPARWVRRLAALAAAAGVEIREHARVASLEELDGATVVVCTDGYPSGLLGPIEGLIIPTRGQVIATEPVPERYFEVPHYGRHGFDYWHQAEDGRIVAGGFRDVSFDSEFTADEQLTEPVQTALARVRQRPDGPRAARRLRVGRHLRHGDGLPAGRRACARARRRLGRRRLLGPRQRARLRLRRARGECGARKRRAAARAFRAWPTAQYRLTARVRHPA